ncbi:9948_t:CDS:2, partial [Racocetra fulgida]
IKALNFWNIMNLEEYINYSEEKDIHNILNDQEILNLATNPKSAKNEMIQYIVQQDLNEVAQSKYNKTLLKLQKEVRKFRNAAFKQANIETYFTSEIPEI